MAPWRPNQSRSPSSWPTTTPSCAPGCAWCSSAPAASRSSLRLATPNRPCGRCSGTSRRSSCSTSTCPASSARSTLSPACRRCRRTRTSSSSPQEDPEFARRALRAGAAGYVLKEAADDELVDAVRRVADGGTYLNPRLGACSPRRRRAFRAAGRPHRARGRGPAADRPGPHQRRDRPELFLSVRTVESHRAHIQQKLNRSTRASSCATRWTTASSKRVAPSDEWAAGARITVPAPAPGSTLSSPPASSTRSRMPASPKPFPAAASVSKPTPSSATDTSTASPAHGPRCRPGGAGVLDDVGERLLDHAIDGRLELGREAAVVGQLDVRADLEVVRRARALRQGRERRRQSELIEGRRAQLGDERAQRLDVAGQLLVASRMAARIASGSSSRIALDRSTSARRAPAASRRAARAPSDGARPRWPPASGGASASTDLAVATAVAACAAKASSSCSSSRVKAPSPSRRSKAASTPRLWPR